MNYFISLNFIGLFLGAFCFAGQSPIKIPITILHTNDLHSHYKADKGPKGLGGVARLATEISRARDESENTLLLDGGDWSEGHIYYKLDAGRTALEMMNALGYDAAVFGNHDWLNGPDHLLDLFKSTPPSAALLAQNIDISKYPRADEFKKYVSPYKIFNVGGLKIGVIGDVTYELIYDSYFAPIAITDPFASTKKLALKLKEEDKVDFVIVISHNGFDTNKVIAGLAGVDLMIHAHDHEKFSQPIRIEKKGKISYMVEAQKWGFYLGKLNLLFNTETRSLELQDYKLVQIDKTIPENPKIARMVENYDRELTSRYGDILTQKIASSNIEVRNEYGESLLGNVITDAYKNATGADAAFEQVSLTSGELYAGAFSSADIFNIIPAIFNPLTQKSWTIKTIDVTGSGLKAMVNFILNIGKSAPGWLPSTSGIRATYNPMKSAPVELWRLDQYLDKTTPPPPPTNSDLLVTLDVGGAPVDLNKKYRIAVSEGLIQALDFVEKFFSIKFERENLQDTQIEEWKALENYLVQNSPIDSSLIPRGERMIAVEPDLALYSDEISISRNQNIIKGSLTIRNLGGATSNENKVHFGYDKTPLYFGDDPNIEAIGHFVKIPSLQAGGKKEITFEFNLNPEFSGIKVPLYFWLERDSSDPNASNERTWLMAPARDGKENGADPRVRSNRKKSSQLDQD